MLVDLWVDQTRITRESQHATVITNMDVSIQGYWVLSPNVLGHVPPMIWVVVFSVLKFLHPAADCHLNHLQAWTVDLLYQAKDGRQYIRVPVLGSDGVGPLRGVASPLSHQLLSTLQLLIHLPIGVVVVLVDNCLRLLVVTLWAPGHFLTSIVGRLCRRWPTVTSSAPSIHFLLTHMHSSKVFFGGCTTPWPSG